MKNLKLNNLFELLLIGMFICVSGGVFFYIEYGEIFVPLFFIMSLVNYVTKDCKIIYFGKKNRKKNYNFYFIIIITALFLLNGVINWQNKINLNEVIIFLLFLFGSFFAIGSMSFSKFKQYFLWWVKYICLFSLIIWGLGFFGLLPYKIKSIGGTNYCMFLLHNLGWDYVQNRNASLFWEPGVFQIVLNVGIFLILFTNAKIEKKQYIVLFLLIIGVASTRSTTGYLVLMLILLIKGLQYLLNHKENFKMIFTIGVLLTILTIFVISTPTISEKFSFENFSFSQRVRQNIMSLELMRKKPMIGYGVNSKVLQDIVTNKYMLSSNSNGLFVLSLYVGIPTTCVFISKFFLTRKKFQIPKIMVFIVFVMFNVTEYIIIFPISYVFIFDFRCRKEESW